MLDTPKTSEERISLLNSSFEDFTKNFTEFKEKSKKAAGSRAKKSLNVIRKLITPLRKDIQEQILAMKKPTKTA